MSSSSSSSSLFNPSMFDVTEEAIFSDMLSDLANECALDITISAGADTDTDINIDIIGTDEGRTSITTPTTTSKKNKVIKGASSAVVSSSTTTPTRKNKRNNSNSNNNNKHKIRRKVDHTYVDYCDQSNARALVSLVSPGVVLQTSSSSSASSSTIATTASTHKKGVFPGKLMDILAEHSTAHIISWCPHGRAFIVRNVRKFEKQVLPRYFKTTQAKSFRKQLSLWGFKRITKGPDAGAYYHQLFLRGKPELLRGMKYQKIKGTGNSAAPNPEGEPDFYEMSRISPLPDIACAATTPLSVPVPVPDHTSTSTSPAHPNVVPHVQMHAHARVHHSYIPSPAAAVAVATNLMPLQLSSIYGTPCPAAATSPASAPVIVQHQQQHHPSSSSSSAPQHQHPVASSSSCLSTTTAHPYAQHVPAVTTSSSPSICRYDDNDGDDAGCYVTEEEDNDVHPDEVLSIYKLMSFPGPFTPPPQLLECTN